MEFLTTALEGVFLVKPKQFKDARGFFCETYRQNTFEEMTGTAVSFVQDNFSYTKQKGTVRGLHFQAPPHAQGKLVRCTGGYILDVAVDIRKNSPTYGQFVSYELSFENGHQLWIPTGFLHGFSTLSDDCEIAYKCTDYYVPDREGSVIWNDPALNIDWQIEGEAILSEKDSAAQSFAGFNSPF